MGAQRICGNINPRPGRAFSITHPGRVEGSIRTHLHFETKRHSSSQQRPVDCSRRVLAIGGILYTLGQYFGKVDDFSLYKTIATQLWQISQWNLYHRVWWTIGMGIASFWHIARFLSLDNPRMLTKHNTSLCKLASAQCTREPCQPYSSTAPALVWAAPWNCTTSAL